MRATSEQQGSPKPFTRKEAFSAVAPLLDNRVMQKVALRYALAPACIVPAVLVYYSPAGPILGAAGPFVFAVLAAAWFGGVGPGLVAAVLATLTLARMVPVSYPLIGGFLDVPRLVTFAVVGLAVGWGSSRRARMLREQERYARAMDSSDDGFWDWIVADDTIYVSPRFLEIYGFAPGTTFAGRDDLIARLPFHEEDRPLLTRAFTEHLAGRTTRYDVEWRFVRDGETRWVQLAGMVARDGSGAVTRWTGTVRDITTRKSGEEALRDSEQRYELAMAASESGYWDWHVPSDRYFASQRAFELGGYPPGTAWVNRDEYRARINMHPDDSAKWEAAREQLFAGTGDRLAMEVRYVVRGETRWHLLRAICRRDETGKVIRWIGSTTDITERKLAEQALHESERELRQAQRLEAMGTLAGGIAHDFNNILGAVLGYGEMALRDAPKGGRLARDLENIMIAGERGRALVDRVLAFSRSAVGERVPVHVERVVREALDFVSAKQLPSVVVHANLHAGSAAVLGDATQVHQVVTNLATNAIQAMPAGGTLRVDLAIDRVQARIAATIGGRAAGEYVVLTVADTGAGIAPDIIDRIFDPFFTTKEVGTGTGLGLSLVHGIVTELGGAIDVASAVGSGSTFVVYLPRCGDAEEPSDEKDSAPPRGDGQCVLIVDDEEPLVQLATRTLADLGYVPIGFTSSAAALAAFRADPARFDALITDERMPEMSGSALIREVRGLRRSMPVVLMSGYLVGASVNGRDIDSPDARGVAPESAPAMGADEVVQKPLSARDLATSLARVLPV
jgi:PAS domain S-box-containing protein